MYQFLLVRVKANYFSSKIKINIQKTLMLSHIESDNMSMHRFSEIS